MVIDKPAGLLSVPGRGADRADCAVARVRAMFADASGPMVVHRLDMDTSGLMLVALNADAQREFSRMFERRSVRKRYEAIVVGAPTEESGEIRLVQRLDVENRPRQVVDEQAGKLSVTRWRVAENHPAGIGAVVGAPSRPVRTRVEFEPITGRSHQIRIAAATAEPRGLACPIVGDDLYGSGAAGGDRLMLAATMLGFTDPSTGEEIEITQPAPF